jgi:hypothetical protein
MYATSVRERRIKRDKLESELENMIFARKHAVMRRDMILE